MNTAVVFTAMLPEHLLLAGIVVLLLLGLADRPAREAHIAALVAVAAAAVSAAVLSAQGLQAVPFAGHFSVDPASLAAKAMALSLALPVLLIAHHEFEQPEFGALLLSTLYGLCLVQSADSFLTLFLGIETLSIPVYVMVLLAAHRTQAAEAALKYLVLGGAATATLLMGAALLYGHGGSLAISAFAKAAADTGALPRTAVLLVLLALFMKAAVVPFHTWAPDAYEAASIPVTAYMAVLVKAAVLLAAVRLFAGAVVPSPLLEVLAVLPLVSIAWGNLAAMRQDNLRRMVAYSSIAHAGYLFLALLGEGSGRQQAVVFYLLAYGALNLLVFTALPEDGDDTRRDGLEHLKGLYRRAPFAAVTIALAMLSLAGIPPLPGFVAKFLVFRNVLAAGHVGVAVAGLVGSYLGIYFYLRVIQLMFMSEGPETTPAGETVTQHRLALGASVMCLVATALVAVVPGWVLGHF